MDDSCAVCADALEWVAYGACGHREVCSTCVVRLRFVMGDKHCCICKTECSSVFVTKVRIVARVSSASARLFDLCRRERRWILGRRLVRVSMGLKYGALAREIVWFYGGENLFDFTN